MSQITKGHAKIRTKRGSDRGVPLLSCELCRERKVRCDKATPHCTTCVKAGMACVPVYRKRYSRGRHTARRSVDTQAKRTAHSAGAESVPQQMEEEDLQDRVRRLECLISDMNREQRDANDLFRDASASQTPRSSLLFGLDPTPSRHGRGNVNTNTSTTSWTERDVKQDFWTDLVKEVRNLQCYQPLGPLLTLRVSPPSTNNGKIRGFRDVLEANTADEENVFMAPSPVSSAQSPLSSRADSVLGVGYTTGQPGQIYMTSPALVTQLCHIFNRQVDPIIKIMHRPTLITYLVDCKGFLDYKLRDPRPAALRAAVCYAAVVSMTDAQFHATFSCPRVKVLPEFRDACDVALNKAGLLTSMDMTVLQAFVLYLVARRAEDPSPAVWTLIAVAVRLAKALSLHIEQPIVSGNFFQRQMRNRLWCSICALDLQASLDQASEPMIDLEVEHHALPRNIDDSDFDMDFQGADIPDRDDLTDMTLSLVTYKAQLSGRLLNFRGITTSTSHKATPWEDRQAQARRFEDEVRPLIETCDPDSSAFAWFTFHAADSVVSSMRLSTLRPLHRIELRAMPRPQHGNIEALASALSALSKVQLVRDDPRGEGFRWYVRTQWHALAIAVSECLVCPDRQLLASAWPVVEAAYKSAHHQQQQQSGDEAAAAGFYHQDGAPRQLLPALMLRTRARVRNFLRGAEGRGVIKAPAVGAGRSGSFSSGIRTPADPFTLQSPPLISLAGIKEAAADPASSDFDFDFGLGPAPALTPSSISPARGTGESVSLGHGPGEGWSHMSTYSSSLMTGTNMDDGVDLEARPDFSWQDWEDIVSGLGPSEGLFDSSTGFC